MGRGGRTSIKGKRAVPKKHLKVSANFAFKHAVVTCLHAFGIQRVRTDYFSQLSDTGWKPKESTIYRWKKQGETIAAAAQHARMASLSRVRPKGIATSLSDDTELLIVKWINELRADGVPVSSSLLALHAIDESIAAVIPKGKFVASPTWLDSFLRRHCFSFRARTRAGQEAPHGSGVVAEEFAAEVTTLMKELGITRVFNADQTAIFYEMLPKKTVDRTGTRTVWVKCGKKEKERATAMLLADSDGNKYPLFLVFKTAPAAAEQMRAENTEKRHGFGKRTWEQVKNIQRDNGVQVCGNAAVWWNSDITVRWLRFHFGDRNPHSPPVLLLPDAFSGHWTTEVKEVAASMNVVLKAIPKCQTWQCQPADVAWIKPIKDRLRRRWVEYLRDKLSQRDPDAQFILAAPNRVDIGAWVSAAWNNLSKAIIIKGFVKCGLRAASADTPNSIEVSSQDSAFDCDIASLEKPAAEVK